MGIPSLPGVSGSNTVAADKATSVVSGTIAAVGPGDAFSVYGAMNFVLYAERTATLTTAAGSLAATVNSATGLAAGAAIKSANVPAGTTIGALSGTNVTLALMPQYWNGTLQPGLTGIQMGPVGSVPTTLATLNGATIVSPYFASGTTVTGYDETARTLTTSNAPTGLTGDVDNFLFEFRPTGNAIVTTGAVASTFTGAGVLFNATVNLERSFDGGQTWVLCNSGGAGFIAQFVGDGSSTGAPISVAFGDPEAAMLYRINCTVYGTNTNIAIKYRISTTGQAATSISLQVI